LLFLKIEIEDGIENLDELAEQAEKEIEFDLFEPEND
jgi:hypothetical protein